MAVGSHVAGGPGGVAVRNHVKDGVFQSLRLGTWKILEMDGGDGWATVSVPGATELCA